MLKPETVDQLRRLRDALLNEQTAIRTAIEAIEGLLRVTSDGDDEEEPPASPPVRLCSICQKPDHRAPRCPEREKVAPAEAAPARRTRRCRFCRKEGHQGDKCAENPFNAARASVKEPAPPKASPAPAIQQAADSARASLSFLSAPPPEPAAWCTDRVCAIHETRVRPIAANAQGRPRYQCERGHETGNTIPRKAEARG